MTPTLRRTSSAASSPWRSNFPSADRHSMTIFFPSTYPSSRSPCRNASTRATLEERDATVRYPIRVTFFGCCASTATATASNAPANRIDASAVFLNGRFISGVIYHAGGSKEKCYLRALLFTGCPSLVSDETTGRHTCRYKGDEGEGSTLGAVFFA